MIVRELVARFGFQVDSSGLDRVDKRIDQTKTDMTQLGTAMRGAFAGLAAYGIGSKVNEAVDAANQFGEAMGKIQSLIPGNVKRAQEYREAIISLAKETGQSLQDVAAGTYDVLSTFGDTADSIDQVAIAVKTGAAGAATTKDGLALLGAVTKAYGDTSAVTMQKVADLGFQTVNLGKVELPELAASIGQATPLAANLGVSMEELFAVMASASGVTGSGAEVMTQMSSAMQSLVKQTEPMKKAWKAAFGKEDVKTAISKYGVVGVFQRLTETTNGSIGQIDALFGRIEGLKLILQLTQKGSGDFADKLQAMQNVVGATDTAFAAMRGGMAASATQSKQLQVEIDALKVKIGDEMAQPIGQLNKAMLLFAQTMTDTLLPAVQEWNGETIETQGLDDVKTAAMSLSAVLTGLVETADLTVTTLSTLGNLVKLGGQEVWDLAGFDFAGMGKDWREREAETQQIWDAFKRRSFKRGAALSDPEFAQQQVELARLSQTTLAEKQAAIAEGAQRRQQLSSSLGVPSQLLERNLNVGGVSITVNTPPGAPAEAIGLAVEGGVTAALQQAAQAIPDRRNRTGTGVGASGAGTNAVVPGG